MTVFDQPDLSGKYTVELDGTFTFPFVGRVNGGRRTIRAFEAALRASLADGFFKNPQVTVAVEAYRSQRVFVVGEVKMPGALPVTGGLTLMEAIARAGSTRAEDASDDVGDRARRPRGRAGGRDRLGPRSGRRRRKPVVRVNLRQLQPPSKAPREVSRCRMATRCSWAVSSPSTSTAR